MPTDTPTTLDDLGDPHASAIDKAQVPTRSGDYLSVSAGSIMAPL